MEISDRLNCLFSAEIEETDDTYVIEIPTQELDVGRLRPNETYRIAVLPAATDRGERGDRDGRSQDSVPEPDANGRSDTETEPASEPEYGADTPPVQEGDRRRVEIEDIGEQGDGITRVERGFVVIVPDTDKGERVVIEITDVAETVAFGEVVERVSYYE